MLADGFGASWTNYLTGADRVGLDHHFCLLPIFASKCLLFTYVCRTDQAFDAGGNNTPLGGQIARSCTGNGGLLNQTMNNFGIAIVGEWSIAMNDCGRFVTAVGDGTSYEGNLCVFSFYSFLLQRNVGP
jgi:glucan 1,3-beta-glucosidase